MEKNLVWQSAIAAVEATATDSHTWEMCVTFVLQWMDPL